MPVTPSLAVHPLSKALKLLSVVPFLLVSEQALALILDNQTLTITDSDAPDRYELRNNSVMTTNGASTRDIRVASGSTLNLNGTTVTGGSSIGVLADGTTVNIAANSTITSEFRGLNVTHDSALTQGGTANVTDSRISDGQV